MASANMLFLKSYMLRCSQSDKLFAVDFALVVLSEVRLTGLLAPGFEVIWQPPTIDSVPIRQNQFHKSLA